MTDDLIRNLRDLAAFAHADLSIADEGADEIERLREALEELRPLVFGANHSSDRYPKARKALEGKDD